jgi:hypothetical protein
MKVERVSKAFFEKRAAAKRKHSQELSRALASGKVSRAELQRKNAHFVGMNVRLELNRAKALW